MESEKTVQVLVVWLSKGTEENLRTEVKKCLDMEYEDKLTRQFEHLYEEPLYEIFCKLHLNKNSLFDNLDNLLSKWCTSEYDFASPIPYPQWWIKCEFSHIFNSCFPNIDNHVVLNSFSFGTLVGLNTYVEHLTSGSPLIKNSQTLKITQIEGNFYHDHEELVIYFILADKNVQKKKQSLVSHRLYRINISYSSICKILIYTKLNLPLTLFLHLNHPPLIYAVEINKNSESQPYVSFRDIDPNTRWNRVTDLNGHWHKIFTLRVLKIEFCRKDWSVISNLLISSKCSKVYFSPINFKKSEKIQNPSIPHSVPNITNTFECIYALKSITTFSSDVSDQIVLFNNLKDVNEELKNCASSNPKALAEALFEIRAALEKGNIIFFKSALKVLFKKYVQCTKDYIKNILLKLPNNLVMIRKCILTPSRLCLLNSYPSCKNRLIRTCDPDYLLRVALKDDNLEKITYHLHGSSESQEKFLKTTVINVLLKGINIGCRHYEFVGCSVSQLREHGVWMYAKDNEGRTASHIRESVGDLSNIHNPAKYMARMGQMLSQAIGSYKVPQHWTNVSTPEEDKTDGFNPSSEKPYVFSDGVGKISFSLAQKVYAELKIEDKAPSAVQIRYAGCKGMLVCDPELEGDRICFRVSMKKFSSNNSSLEILKTSKPRLILLNRPFITILEQMGIEIEVFCRLQKDMMHRLAKSLTDDETAADILFSHSQFSINFLDVSRAYIPYETSLLSLCQAGIMVANEPFFRGLIQAVFKKSIGMLKTKARIEIPKDKGRSMFGVLDEYGKLEYGEVFVKYSNDMDKYSKNDPATVLTGTVLITKNPCMHPGDVRKFIAVDVPELHHIRDCIVFPRKGNRPHPDEMAGSDLDGDEYCVIWFDDLIFKAENYKPMNYPSSEEQDFEKEVEVEDTLNFLCSYIINDHVGRLGNAHLAWADKDRKGIFSKVCLDIARKNAVNLDFAKTGKSENLSKNEKVFSYPDFMEKLSHSNTYISRRALGVLFRQCKNFEICLDAINDNIGTYCDHSLLVEGWEKYVDNAKQALNLYRKSVNSLLTLYAVDNEGELVSCAISQYSKYIRERNDSDLAIILEICVKEIFHTMRELFFAEFLDSGNVKDLDCVNKKEIRKKASAWYSVTCTENTGQSVPCFGLPWVVSDILIEIKNQALSKNKVQLSTNFAHTLSKSLETSLSLDKKIKESNEECYRASLINTVYIALNTWLTHNKLFFMLEDEEFHAVRKLVNSVIENITSGDLAYIGSNLNYNHQTSMIKNQFSSGHYVLKCLEHIAKIYYFDNDCTSLFQVKLNLGMLALITFLKLSSSPNPEYLGISSNTEKPELIINQKPQTEMIRLPLDNEKFNDCVVHKEEQVKNRIKSLTGVESIYFRLVLERFKGSKDSNKTDKSNVKNDDCADENEKHSSTNDEADEKWAVYMLVTGSKWSLAYLKNLVIQKWFYTSLNF